MSGESFAELLRWSRMVRSYLPDPIEPETIERIVLAARRPPSAGFSSCRSPHPPEGLATAFTAVPASV